MNERIITRARASARNRKNVAPRQFKRAEYGFFLSFSSDKHKIILLIEYNIFILNFLKEIHNLHVITYAHDQYRGN